MRRVPLAIPYPDNSGRVEEPATRAGGPPHKGPNEGTTHRSPAASQDETPGRRAGSRQGGDPRTRNRNRQDHDQAGGDRRRPSYAAVKRTGEPQSGEASRIKERERDGCPTPVFPMIGSQGVPLASCP